MRCAPKTNVHGTRNICHVVHGAMNLRILGTGVTGWQFHSRNICISQRLCGCSVWTTTPTLTCTHYGGEVTSKYIAYMTSKANIAIKWTQNMIWTLVRYYIVLTQSTQILRLLMKTTKPPWKLNVGFLKGIHHRLKYFESWMAWRTPKSILSLRGVNDKPGDDLGFVKYRGYQRGAGLKVHRISVLYLLIQYVAGSRYPTFQ